MTELEIMQHAKSCLDKLAKGINPLTDQEVSENDVINNVRISRCLFYVSDVLRQVIENGGVIGAPTKKGELAPYSLPFEARSRYTFGDWPLSASQIARRLNELVNLDAIIAINAAPLHENHGKPWEPEEDAYLRQAVQGGADVKDMSAELKRTRAAVRARLEKLGLTEKGERA